jgi:ribonuclease J
MLKVIPLGGVGEIGLNMMAVEYDQYILVIDAGLMFPDDYLPGVDLVIPDFQYLRENKEKITAIILTHGHEDHIGAMPFFLKEFPAPVYGTSFTLALLEEKLKEHRLPIEVDLRKIKPGDVTKIGVFKVEYISVTHSIVEGIGLAIETPEGIIVHSGDFKIDSTPVDSQITDLGRFAYFGAQGVLAFFSDSTNAEKEGFTLSEKEVRKTLESFFRTCKGRIIVAGFASSITRIQQVVNLARKFGRKVLFNGKSMITNVEIARQHGFIHMPDELSINERQLDMYDDKEITMITTGSQGEPMSALARMARGTHKNIKIKKGDTIILSSRFIPGNEGAITSIINRLYRMGADVIYEKVSAIHTSGHANREELKIMLGLVKPRYFIPIHGEYRHLVKHSRLALDIGMPKEHVFVIEDGDTICFENTEAKLGSPVHAGRVLVDGKGVGDVSEMVLKDRRRLSDHGMVVALVVVNNKTGRIVYGPNVFSRGFVFENQGGPILEKAKGIVLELFDETTFSAGLEWSKLQLEIERRLKKFFFNVIERNPLILPIIIPL